MQWSRIRGSGSDAAVLRALARRDPRAKAWLKQTGIDRALLCSFEREPRFGRHAAKAVEPMADALLAGQFRASDAYIHTFPLPAGLLGSTRLCVISHTDSLH